MGEELHCACLSFFFSVHSVCVCFYCFVNPYSAWPTWLICHRTHGRTHKASVKISSCLQANYESGKNILLILEASLRCLHKMFLENILSTLKKNSTFIWCFDGGDGESCQTGHSKVSQCWLGWELVIVKAKTWDPYYFFYKILFSIFSGPLCPLCIMLLYSLIHLFIFVSHSNKTR